MSKDKAVYAGMAAMMLLLCIAFGLVWVVCMALGVAQTCRRKRLARLTAEPAGAKGGGAASLALAPLSSADAFPASRGGSNGAGAGPSPAPSLEAVVAAVSNPLVCGPAEAAAAAAPAPAPPPLPLRKQGSSFMVDNPLTSGRGQPALTQRARVLLAAGVAPGNSSGLSLGGRDLPAAVAPGAGARPGGPVRHAAQTPKPPQVEEARVPHSFFRAKQSVWLRGSGPETE